MTGGDRPAMRRGVRLGVDVGSVRVGLAASDPDGLLASAVDTLARDEAGDADLREVVAEAARRDAIEVVVGLPLSLSGREGPAATLARGYAVDLARLLAPTPVRLVDERLSTVAAHQQLRGAGVKGRRHRVVVDQVAAVVVLQSALDAERASGRAPGSLVDPGPVAEGPPPSAQEATPG